MPEPACRQIVPFTECHHFEASCLPSAQSLMRVIGLFGQRDMLPLSIEVSSSDEAMTIRIVQAGLDDHQANVMLEKMRVMPNTIYAALNACTSANLRTENLVLCGTLR